jgi:2,3-bisphosphoglycerate-independent phosphoglycerate mutase
LDENPVIKKTFQSAAAGNGRLHLCGLVSHGGVVSLRLPLGCAVVMEF